ncbi:hypothetical protein DH2020_024177 [Rehmannia glutinosa]|uniref:Uncharacterized protein n=1 Tax=Rehmannia glutinosa TaxID=99300 RepID=A0ABR0W9U5_REHGL
METKKISHTLNSLILFATIISLNTYSSYSLSPVLDLDGNHLQTNTNYHILPLPAAANNDGGASPLSVGDPAARLPTSCKKNDKTSVGLSLRFFQRRIKTVSRHYKFECRFEHRVHSRRHRRVMTDGVEGRETRLGHAAEDVRSDGVLGAAGRRRFLLRSELPSAISIRKTLSFKRAE